MLSRHLIPVELANGRNFEYTPDFFLVLENGTGVLVEIKSPIHMSLLSNLKKWIALNDYRRKKARVCH